jgi:hypothetical protein
LQETFVEATVVLTLFTEMFAVIVSVIQALFAMSLIEKVPGAEYSTVGLVAVEVAGLPLAKVQL